VRECAQSRAQNQKLFFGEVSFLYKPRRDTCLNESLAFADHKRSEVEGRTDYYLVLCQRALGFAPVAVGGCKSRYSSTPAKLITN
jgi:hypothetical protein